MGIKKDLKWKLLFTTFLILITTIPYYIACRKNINYVFSGFLFGTEDGNSYIAKMLIGTSGHWLFTTPYTAEPQKGFLAFLPYIVLGKFASSGEQHSQLIALFQLFRVAGIFVYILSVYDFISHFIKDQRLVKIGVVFASLGGGVGWLSILGLENLWSSQLPLEFYSPESFGFLSLYGLPHLAFARAFLLWGLMYFLKANTCQDRKKYLFRSSLSLFLVGFFQPLTVAIGIGLIFSYTGFEYIREYFTKKKLMDVFPEIKMKIKNAFWVSLLPGSWVIYNFISFTIDPFLNNWQKQNIIKSPPIQDYLLAYLLMIPFMMGGLFVIIKHRKKEFSFILLWILCFPILAYAPYNLQRRLPEGIWIGIIVSVLVFHSEFKIPKVITNILLGLSILPQLIILTAGVQLANNPSIPVFRPIDEIEAFLFLSENSEPGDIVLASYESSNPLPAWAPVHTLTGHGPESVKLEIYEKTVKDFFSDNTSSDFREKILTSNHINFVIWGPSEKALGDWDPQTCDQLIMVFDKNEYKIFSVR